MLGESHLIAKKHLECSETFEVSERNSCSNLEGFVSN